MTPDLPENIDDEFASIVAGLDMSAPEIAQPGHATADDSDELEWPDWFVRQGDKIVVQLPDPVRQNLAALADMFEHVLDAGPRAGAAYTRLHPATYEDPLAELEYASDDSSLLATRRQDIVTIRASVNTSSITVDQALAWMRTFSSFRTAILTAVGADHENSLNALQFSDPETNFIASLLGGVACMLADAIYS